MTGPMFQVETMSDWPYPTTVKRRVSPFTASWSATLDQLRAELVALRVSGAVALRVVGPAGSVRRDGMLRAGVRLTHPGVAVSFTSASLGALTYPCDTFLTANGAVNEAWKANVRAVALALEALRKIDRYGVAGRGEQYAGWRQIEAAPAPSRGVLHDARAFLMEVSGLPAGSPVNDLVRAARARAHPDRNNDRRALWDRVEAARAVLEKGL